MIQGIEKDRKQYSAFKVLKRKCHLIFLDIYCDQPGSIVEVKWRHGLYWQAKELYEEEQRSLSGKGTTVLQRSSFQAFGGDANVGYIAIEHYQAKRCELLKKRTVECCAQTQGMCMFVRKYVAIYQAAEFSKSQLTMM